MRLYSGTSTGFIDDTVHNRITEKLKDAFSYAYRRSPGNGEINSWRNSLRATSQIFDAANLTDHGVILEYELPLSSKRLDVMVVGRDEMLNDQAVIIELKQWDRCQEGFGNKVVTFVGGNNRDLLHPSVQVGQYKNYLQDAHTAFYEGSNPVQLSACAYLHNYDYDSADILFADRFQPFIKENPLYTADDSQRLIELLKTKLVRGGGEHVLQRVEESKYRPSKKLLDHVGQLLEGKTEYVLLDEQLIAFERVLAAAKEGLKSRTKSIILIRGGPGTGKSVIALNLLARLSKDQLATHYVTGSRAFTETLREIVGPRAANLCKNFSSYMQAESETIEVMVCDEAHRMWQKSFSRWISKEKYSGKLQIEELIHASRVTVFFIDDAQSVRCGEIGTSQYVIETAKKTGCAIYDYQLEAQFRCSGSDAFINWITNTLEVKTTPEVVWNSNDAFDFKICETVEELDEKIKARVSDGYKARLTAGFCWAWSKPNQDGSLVDDVQVGHFKRPWNAKPGAGRLAADIPSASLWAYDARGVNQVGCIYTAQGFEFDYVGIIFGPDLVYRKGKGWLGVKTMSCDKEVKRAPTVEEFARLVKNTYRVLFTRGMKGCYVYFVDKETEDFFRSRTESAYATVVV
jgi:DUF2075 family protein